MEYNLIVQTNQRKFEFSFLLHQRNTDGFQITSNASSEGGYEVEACAMVRTNLYIIASPQHDAIKRSTDEHYKAINLQCGRAANNEYYIIRNDRVDSIEDAKDVCKEWAIAAVYYILQAVSLNDIREAYKYIIKRISDMSDTKSDLHPKWTALDYATEKYAIEVKEEEMVA